MLCRIMDESELYEEFYGDFPDNPDIDNLTIIEEPKYIDLQDFEDFDFNINEGKKE